MSASTKKKLRNQLNADKLTDRQLAEQAEAKKLKLYTTAFALVLALILVIAVTVGVTQTINNSGIREKNTVAMTAGTHEISNAEMSYYFVDSVNTFYSQNGSYAAMFGLDVTRPLDEQVMDENTGETWAQYLLTSAKNTAASVYAMNDAAEAAGFVAPESVQSNVEITVTNLQAYGMMYGYTDATAYLKAMYGQGASLESYRDYITKSLIADAYYNAYSESLTYEDADLRAAEADNFHAYSSFNYNYYYLAASRFLEGGTVNEDGTTTYTNEEKAASVAAAKAAADTLVSEEITSVEDLDAAIAALSVNADTTAASTLYEDNPYNYIASVVSDWLSDESRKEGDLACLENASTSEDGTKTVNGYYIVYFHSVNDNNFNLKNVRHILVKFEGGNTDASTGVTTYTDEEKAAAKAEAEQLLADFKAGEATEAAFAGLAAEKSEDTGSTANGGLYEDIYPGQMVAAFEDWCFDNSRSAGDTGIVETEYGYHVMYFSGNSDTVYRDMLIRDELSQADLAEWYNTVNTSLTITDGDYKYVPTDLVLSR